MRRSLHLVVSLLVLSILLGGCTTSPALSPDEQAIRAKIERYDQLLADGYRAMNMNAMREVADQLQSEDEYIHMSSLAEGGVRLDPELKDLQFLKVSVEATSARAETRETWDGVGVDPLSLTP